MLYCFDLSTHALNRARMHLLYLAAPLSSSLILAACPFSLSPPILALFFLALVVHFSPPLNPTSFYLTLEIGKFWSEDNT